MASEAKLKENLWHTGTFMTAAAVTRGEVAHLDGSGCVINADADAEENIGIFCEDADSGTPVRVALHGSVVKAVAYDNAISEGEDLVAATSGRVDGAGALGTATTYIVGKALSGSDAAGQLIPIVVTIRTRSKSTA